MSDISSELKWEAKWDCGARKEQNAVKTAKTHEMYYNGFLDSFSWIQSADLAS